MNFVGGEARFVVDVLPDHSFVVNVDDKVDEKSVLDELRVRVLAKLDKKDKAKVKFDSFDLTKLVGVDL